MRLVIHLNVINHRGCLVMHTNSAPILRDFVERLNAHASVVELDFFATFDQPLENYAQLKLGGEIKQTFCLLLLSEVKTFFKR